jgi:GT2 family glycosyltransferase
MADEDPCLGAVGPKLITSEGRLFAAGSLIFSDGSGWDFGHGDDLRRPEYQLPCEVDFCSTVCLLIRRDLFEQVGGYDPQFSPTFYEDADLGFSLLRLGYTMVYAPEAMAIYHSGLESGSDFAGVFRQAGSDNKKKFVKKWEHELTLQEASPAFTLRRPITADRKRRFESAGTGLPQSSHPANAGETASVPAQAVPAEKNQPLKKTSLGSGLSLGKGFFSPEKGYYWMGKPSGRIPCRT